MNFITESDHQEEHIEIDENDEVIISTERTKDNHSNIRNAQIELEPMSPLHMLNEGIP